DCLSTCSWVPLAYPVGHSRLPTAISNDLLEILDEMVDCIKAGAGHILSIDAIVAESQDLKTMLIDISLSLSSLETREQSTFLEPKRHFRRQSKSRNTGNQEHW
ncbi:hypothetical protein NPIL_500971, partial [Nephila pilipes]